MSPSHPVHEGAGASLPGWGLAAALALLALALSAYAVAARRARRAPRGWSGLRTASFALGVALLAAALVPSLAHTAHHDPRVHMLQHLLIGMYAPLALVMAAPLTLALRTLPTARRRPVARVLRSRPLHVLGHPATALLLDTGGLYLVHLTPVHAAAQTHPAVHALVHLHYLAAGYLFAWSVAGPDPAPRRPGTATRLTALILAVAAHSFLAKLLYAHPHTWPPGAEHTALAGEAAQLMYYGGDLAELLLAVALFAAWYRRRSRTPRPPAAASPPNRRPHASGDPQERSAPR
ncbi:MULTISPECIES: cytochrome c oxidase assembly protein [unclassified Nocardiopsis]|uniref:cytochrome c oxidase assembly protein n=1 Tax=unclassified Nocardiopsis TaxID=2649073 RepID=UPI0009F8A4ED|nr:cytochrome c oxidase assembly protein [Nocardiopsis sp. TSRI0078]